MGVWRNTTHRCQGHVRGHRAREHRAAARPPRPPDGDRRSRRERRCRRGPVREPSPRQLPPTGRSSPRRRSRVPASPKRPATGSGSRQPRRHSRSGPTPRRRLVRTSSPDLGPTPTSCSCSHSTTPTMSARTRSTPAPALRFGRCRSAARSTVAHATCPDRCCRLGEIGLPGSEALAAEYDTHNSPRAVLTIDGAGQVRDPRALTHGCRALAEPVRAVTEQSGQPAAQPPTTQPQRPLAVSPDRHPSASAPQPPLGRLRRLGAWLHPHS